MTFPFFLVSSTSDTAGFNQSAVLLNANRDRRTASRVFVPIHYIKPLPIDAGWGSRHRDEDWVLQLEKMVGEEATIPDHNIKLCCHFPSLVENYKIQDHNITESLVKTWSESGLYAYSGEHSRACLEKFNMNNPTNIFTKGIYCPITFVDLNSKADTDMLLQLGYRANKLSSASKGLNQKAYVDKIHAILVSDLVLKDHIANNTDWPVEAEYVEYFMQIFNFKKDPPVVQPGTENDKMTKTAKDNWDKEQGKFEGQVRFYCQVARAYTTEWEIIQDNLELQERLEAGKVAVGGQSKISVWWYQPLVSLPRTVRIEIMEASDPNSIGHMQPAEIKKLASRYKGEEKVRAAVVRQFNDKRRIDRKYEEAKSFTDVIEQIPKLNDEGFLTPYYFAAAGKGSWQPPEAFLQKVYDIMLTQANSKAAQKERTVNPFIETHVVTS